MGIENNTTCHRSEGLANQRVQWALWTASFARATLPITCVRGGTLQHRKDKTCFTTLLHRPIVDIKHRNHGSFRSVRKAVPRYTAQQVCGVSPGTIICIDLQSTHQIGHDPQCQLLSLICLCVCLSIVRYDVFSQPSELFTYLSML